MQEQGAAPSPRGQASGRQQAGTSVSTEGVPGGLRGTGGSELPWGRGRGREEQRRQRTDTAVDRYT